MAKKGKRSPFRILIYGILALVAVFSLVRVAATQWYLHAESGQNLSSDYTFDWKPFLARAQLTYKGKTMTTFPFRPRPFVVWLYEPKDILAIITTDTGYLDGAHGVYVVADGEVKKVFQASRVVFADGSESPGNVSALTFTPNGSYLIIGESGYEGGRSIVIDLKDMSTVNPENTRLPSLYGDIYWSPNGQCFVNALSSYGAGSRIAFGTQQDDGSYELLPPEKDYAPGDAYPITVQWDQNGCTGVMSVDQADTDGDGEDETLLLQFDAQTGITQRVTQHETELIETSERDDIIKIYEVTARN